MADKSEFGIIKNLEITGLSHDGRGIGFHRQTRLERLPVFICGALPGDTVDCAIIKNKKKWLEGRLLDTISSSLPPVEPLCPHFGQCGGCALQRMPYPLQLHWKKDIAANAMLRIGRFGGHELASAWRETLPSPLLTAFRNKVEFAFGYNSKKKFVLGFRRKESHEVIDIRSCALIEDIALKIKLKMAEYARSSGFIPYSAAKGGFWRFLTLRWGQDPLTGQSGWLAICLTSRASREHIKKVAAIGEKLLAEFPDLFMFIHEERTKQDILAKPQKRLNALTRTAKSKEHETGFSLKLLDQKFLLDAGSFFQVNTSASQLLAAKIVSFDKTGGNLLDLYCGVGAPGQLLAPVHDYTLGIDLDAISVKYAGYNARSLQQSCWLAGDMSSVLKKNSPAFGKMRWQEILVDPPRAGIDAAALNKILTFAPETIIYISCNSSTLARDALEIKKNYNLMEFAGVDLFPHTPHLECCTLWKRK